MFKNVTKACAATALLGQISLIWLASFIIGLTIVGRIPINPLDTKLRSSAERNGPNKTYFEVFLHGICVKGLIHK